ncbi:DUF2252 family protein [Paenibacillus thalictri]|uniref:DUF2252 domain-containing protein n=1 Tax=Paenibacillus thalictri TaxID=2527873 RepID=A0A4Q9DMP8_9BACL|nr:DUF2252 family protein [Paenibacillus thalictri]TBL76054.1 DUF2252 domain-containing protein [Paenibacillus thalictri]
MHHLFLKRSSRMWVTYVALLSLVCSSMAGLLGLAQGTAHATETFTKTADHVVISKFNPAGNRPSFSSGTTVKNNNLYKYDFIELYNPSGAAVDLAGWKLQYATKSSGTWQTSVTTNIYGTIQPHGYFLIQEDFDRNPSGAEALDQPKYGADLPTPDITASSATGIFKMDKDTGKIELVGGDASIKDAVVYGDSDANSAPAMKIYNYYVRKAVSPANPSGSPLSTSSADGTPNANENSYGNGYNSGVNVTDFEVGGSTSISNTYKSNPANVRNSQSARNPQKIYALADSLRNSVTMATYTTVDSSKNTVALQLPFLTQLSSSFNESSVVVSNLPQGLTYTVVLDAAGHKLEVRIAGTAVNAVTANQTFTVQVKAAGVTSGEQTDSDPVSFTVAVPLPKVNAALVSGSVKMSTAMTVDPNQSSFTVSVLNVSGVSLKDTLDPSSYALTPALPQGLSLSATVNDAKNQITFRISGTSSIPVTKDQTYSLVLHNSVLTNTTVDSQTIQDSDPVGGITIQKMNTVSDLTRKNFLANSIKASNAFFSDPAMKADKYVTQAAGSFDFFRGTPDVFFKDLNTSVFPVPDAWKQMDLKTTVQGDAHLQNVGTFENASGQVKFELNDFDSSAPAPFYWDLLRMVPSLFLERDNGTATEKSLTDADMADIINGFLDEYRSMLAAVNGDGNLLNKELTTSNVDGFTKTLVDKMAAVTLVDQLDGAVPVDTQTQTRKFKTNSKYVVLTAAERQLFEANWNSYLASIDSFVRSKNPGYFNLKDVVYRVNQGNASRGSTRFNVLIEGDSTGQNDDVLLDVKEEYLPTLFTNPETDRSQYDAVYGTDHGKRVMDNYKKMTANTENYAGWMTMGGRSFLVRAIAISKGDYTEIKTAFASKTDFANYMKYAAQSYALAHARSASGFAGKFVNSMDDNSWAAFKQKLLDLSAAYYMQSKSDYALMQAEMASGALLDVTHLSGLEVTAGSGAAQLTPAFVKLTPYEGYSANVPVRNYSASVTNETAVSIKATAADSKAKVTLNGSTADGVNTQMVALQTGVNPIQVTVTARDGSVMTYTISVMNISSSGGGSSPGSSNADLRSLVLAGGNISPAFASGTTEYTLKVPNGVSSTTVTSIRDDAANAAVTASVYNGTGALVAGPLTLSDNAASAALPLDVGSNTIKVAVVAQDGTTKLYTVTVVRAEAVTAGSGTPIPVTDAPVSISVPQGVTNAKLAVTTTTAGENKQATLPLVDVAASTTLGNVSVSIPEGTTITAPAGWDGTIKLPEVKDNASVSVGGGSVSAVIEVGSPDVTLTFDKAVRLLIPGQGGKSAGFVKSGVFTPLTGTITEDSQAAADREIAAGGEAAITVGGDLVIWTKHFTMFASYTKITYYSSSSSSGGGGGPVNSGTISGTNGGTLTLNGVIIEVPAGAAEGSLQVTVDKVADTSVLPANSALQLIGDVFEIKKDKDGDFGKSVIVTLPFDKSKVDLKASNVGIYWLNEQTRSWVQLSDLKVDQENGKVSGSVNHFTKFAVLASKKGEPTQQPTGNETAFADLGGHWAEASVRELVKLGAINGYPDGSFKPDTNITRAEFVAVIVKAFHLNAQTGKSFGDTGSHWAKSVIETAAALGVVSGYNDTVFGPDDFITREQMAAIVVRAAQITPVDKELRFTDSVNVSGWARASLAAAIDKGLMNGYENGALKPQANSTRAEAAAMILRALQQKK